ncbi:ATP-binding protein [Streptosporangiaceae bacterium NEAU-GS5]|nr:ATP-binding protein [Streptosporangiaceae bacterium NEAU-GS5]
MADLALSPKVLERLDFGAPAAERDIARGLEHYFVESPAFNRVQSGAKTIVLGSRGSGKSAIFQVLAKRARDAGARVIELTPDDYSYELLSSTMAAENAGSWAKHGAYAAAWKYLLYVMIMKEAGRKGMRLGRGGGAEVHRYLRDNHSQVGMGRLALLVSYLKRLENVKLGPIEAGARTRELDRLYQLEEIHSLLPALHRVLDDVRIVVLVDELDRGWDSSEDAQAFISGLFQACVSVNSLHPNLRVYVSLRQELYDDIPALYEDAQKYRDLVETVHWTAEALLELIAKRIRHSARELGYDSESLARVSDMSCWNAVFGRVPGQPVSASFTYVVERTLHRPREIIEFCTAALEAARDRKPTMPLPLAAISWAEHGYSADRAKDIAAEFRFQYPGLLSVFDAFRGGDCRYDRDALEYACLELATGEVRVDHGAQWWLESYDPDRLIEVLWHVGFMTARVNGGPFVGPHQVPYLNLAGVKQFQIHPMFWNYLGTITRETR